MPTTTKPRPISSRHQLHLWLPEVADFVTDTLGVDLLPNNLQLAVRDLDYKGMVQVKNPNTIYLGRDHAKTSPAFDIMVTLLHELCHRVQIELERPIETAHSRIHSALMRRCGVISEDGHLLALVTNGPFELFLARRDIPVPSDTPRI